MSYCRSVAVSLEKIKTYNIYIKVWCRTVVVSQCRWRKYRFTIYIKVWCHTVVVSQCRCVAGGNIDLLYIVKGSVVLS